ANLLARRESAGVIVSGEAGVGKTRLAAEAVRAAEAAGCATFRVTATRAAATIPFGAFAQLLPPPSTLPAGQPAFLRRAARTRGNVLFLRELVFEGLERGLLVRSGGVWRWAGPIAPGRRLVELVESRIGHLEGDERGVLELVAFGEPLGAQVLEELVPVAAID